MLCGHAKGQVSSITLPNFVLKKHWQARPALGALGLWAGGGALGGGVGGGGGGRGGGMGPWSGYGASQASVLWMVAKLFAQVWRLIFVF